jgi:hypothetical protein
MLGFIVGVSTCLREELPLLYEETVGQIGHGRVLRDVGRQYVASNLLLSCVRAVGLGHKPRTGVTHEKKR